MRNTMVVPCIVNRVLYCDAVSSVPFGPASWRRISSASTPPITKKTRAVAPYMIPIFLWSIVVNQLQKPVVALGRRSGSGRVATRGSAPETVVIRGLLTALASSFLRQQELGDLLGLVSSHHRVALRCVLRERRHANARDVGSRRQTAV